MPAPLAEWDLRSRITPSWSMITIGSRSFPRKCWTILTSTADWTWADEQAAAEQLTDAASGAWGDHQPVSFYEYYKALAQNGGEFLADRGLRLGLELRAARGAGLAPRVRAVRRQVSRGVAAGGHLHPR